MDKDFAVEDWGRRPYGPSLQAQRELQERVIQGDAPETIVLVEHDPVITVTRKAEDAGHVVATEKTMQQLGIEVHPTDRGGDVTYHGPGQLVAYPILRLRDHDLNLSTYMRLLETVVIETVERFGVEAWREDGLTGVWTHGPVDPLLKKPTLVKLCALGVRIRKHVTMHGLALNVHPDLSHFQTIIPCGITDHGVTSLHTILGEQCPSMDEVKATLVKVMREQLAFS